MIKVTKIQLSNIFVASFFFFFIYQIFNIFVSSSKHIKIVLEKNCTFTNGSCGIILSKQLDF